MWIIVAIAGWAAVAIFLAVILGRAIRVADARESPDGADAGMARQPAEAVSGPIPAPRKSVDPSLTG